MSPRHRRAAARERLEIDPIACAGHGLCAELLPELVELDDWGYPMLADDDAVPPELAALARRAADACPTLALHRRRVAAGPPRPDLRRSPTAGQ